MGSNRARPEWSKIIVLAVAPAAFVVTILGLVGFMVLFTGALVVLWRVDPRYGTLAFAILLMRLVQSQMDLFWVAVQVSIPFVVVGVCLGVEALESEARRVASSLAVGERIPTA